MANVQATLRALIMHLHSLEVLAFSLNEMLYQDTHAGKHLSLFLGLVDTRRNVLHYINAGQCRRPSSAARAARSSFSKRAAP
jgi:serine phosphatase RsbU (regulator of sigma subunit)